MYQRVVKRKFFAFFLTAVIVMACLPAVPAGAEEAAAPQDGSQTETLPAAPLLSISARATTSITVNWDKGIAPVTSYQLQYALNRAMTKGRTSRTVSSRDIVYYKASSLQPGTAYYFRVRAKSAAGYGSWSPVASASTKDATRKQLAAYIQKASTSTAVKTFQTDYKLSSSASGKELIAYVSSLRKRYTITFVMIDIKTGQGLSCRPSKVMYSASCLKGPYVAAINKWSPTKAKKYKSLQYQTIVYSNNTTYKSLHKKFGTSPMKKILQYSYVAPGSFNTSARYTYIRCRDLGKLWLGNYWYFYKTKNANSNTVLSLYTHGTQSFIYRGMKGRFTVHAKPGWYPGGGYNVQNDAGIVMAKVNGKSRPYMVCIMTSACGQHAKLQNLVKKIDAVHTSMVQ